MKILTYIILGVLAITGFASLSIGLSTIYVEKSSRMIMEEMVRYNDKLDALEEAEKIKPLKNNSI